MRAPRWENGDGPTLVRPAPARQTTPLPSHFGLIKDPASLSFDHERVLMGGSPLRLLRLTARAGSLIRKWEAGGAVGDRKAEQILARRLVSSGVFHPRPGPTHFRTEDVTVVIPVRDRPASLDRLLSALTGMECLVVDDGSTDPRKTREIVEDAGGRFLALATNSGPAAARNAGLGQVTTPLVVFIDSDCVPVPGWLEPLLAHFEDPMVAAAAPRIVPLPLAPPTALSRYEAVRSSLDRGNSGGLVRPLSRIPYVPTAALMLRRAVAGDVLFDRQLRGGEDVDLVWRLVEAGWDVRYEPGATVHHDGPTHLDSWLVRRTFYGTTAGALALRHPQSLVPLRASAWSVAVWALVCARRPFLAVGVLTASIGMLAYRLKGVVEEPVTVATKIAGGGTLTSALPAVHGLIRAWSPALVLGLFWRRTRRAAVLALVIPALKDWRSDRTQLDPLRYAAVHMADDIAYGWGIWLGCLRARTFVPLLPRIAFRARVWSRASLRSQLKNGGGLPQQR
jgi:mycofactocin glycosyltransferase